VAKLIGQPVKYTPILPKDIKNKIHWGIKAGMNGSTFPHGNYLVQGNFNFGGYINYKNWQIEIFIVKKVAIVKYDYFIYSQPKKCDVYFDFNYLEIPILYKIPLMEKNRLKISSLLGVYIAPLLGSEVQFSGSGLTMSISYSVSDEEVDFGPILNFEVEMNKILFDARISYRIISNNNGASLHMDSYWTDNNFMKGDEHNLAFYLILGYILY
jgi:hypothetical protein